MDFLNARLRAAWQNIRRHGGLQFATSEQDAEDMLGELVTAIASAMTGQPDFDFSRLGATGFPPERLGVYIQPTASGHTPDLTDPDIGQAYAELNLPCIVSSRVLYARRELVGGHTARAVWAPIESRINNANVGDEIVTAWASGTDYQVGDRVDAGSGSTLAICVQDHTSTVGGATGDPDDENTGYEAYWNNLGSVAGHRIEFAGFAGVGRTIDVTNPGDGVWVYDIFDGVAYAARYTAGDGLWHVFDPSSEGIHNMLGVFANANEALEEVHFFSTSQTTAAIIDGRLNILTYWNPPADGQAEYHWRSRASSPGAPYLIGTLAAGTRGGDDWHTALTDGYETLVELGAEWMYAEVDLLNARGETGGSAQQIVPLQNVRVGALTAQSAIVATQDNAQNSVGVRPHTATSAADWADGATTIWFARNAGGDLLIAGSNPELISSKIDFYAIR